MKRLLDIVLSAFALIILFAPGLLIIALIKLDSSGPAFFSQTRVGQLGKPFQLLKFRTMKPDSEKKGQLTVGQRDPRVTRIGHVLRKYKLDELPQLINILKGDMSVIGPRPEVPKYVAMYDEEQLKVLRAKPGLSDYASLEYFEENALLAQSANPEETYINEVMPAKLTLNLKYIDDMSVATDFKLILMTIKRILS